MKPAVLCLIAALSCFALGGVFLAYILVVSGRTRSMTNQEVVQRMLARDPHDQPSIAIGRGVGVRREASINIDGLRQLAKQGEWGLFWCWPCMLTLVFLGMQLLCVAASMADRQLVFALAGASVCVPAILIAWFMPWAAVYTQIDADTAEQGSSDG